MFTNILPTRSDSIVSDFTPYSGTWTYEHAAHLLRRTTFGANPAQVKDAVAAGMSATVQMLLQDRPMPSPPLNYSDPNDAVVPIGETWVNAKYSLANLQDELLQRTRSLYAWQMKTIVEDGMSLREKMVLFWQNHFVTADINDPKFAYRKSYTLRTHALDNFRTLVEKITIDPAMLRYLNGNQNKKNAPNENYARELLELFTVGKGQPAGAGDYGTFTEQDVKEIAKALTGWKDYGFANYLNSDFGSEFKSHQHDTSTKQLSHRLGNAIISNAGADEYKQVIDIILQQRATAIFLCRQLYIWLIYHDIDATTQQAVIEPMAQILLDHNYEIKPALQALLTSEHFYDSANRGCIIKNPIDFTSNILLAHQVAVPTTLKDQYTLYSDAYNFASLQGMDYFNPPIVAGWKAYYQEPIYYRAWINAVTLPQRMSITDLMAYNGLEYSGEKYIIDVLGIVAGFSNPLDPNDLVRELSQMLLPQPITPDQEVFLKNAILFGLPDFEWTLQYGAYTQDPTDPQKRVAIELKLRHLFATIMKMPEYYLS